MPKASKERSKKFKKDDFALQVMIAMGDRPVSVVCKKNGIDYRMVKDYMNENRDLAPGFKFLKKIASVSCDKSVNLESLALASGYASSEIEARMKKEAAAEPATKVVTNTTARTETNIVRPSLTGTNTVLENDAKPVPKVEHCDAYHARISSNSLVLSAFIKLAETYDEYSPVKYYIFDNKDAFKKFGKLVRLYGLNKAMETANKDERPIFELDRDTILKFLSDKPIAGFCALNGNKIAIVF